MNSKLNNAQMTATAAGLLSAADINVKSFVAQFLEALTESFDDINGESGDIEINSDIHLIWKAKNNIVLIMAAGENAEIDYKHNVQFMN